MARLTALLALFLMLIVSGPVAVAADQPQATAGDNAKSKPAKPASNKTKAADKSKTTKKPAAKVPTVKAPVAKPAQPVPTPAPVPAPEAKPPEKADAAKPGDAKAGPRFAALRAERVYLRAGPGPDFPIQWVFVRRGLPVEILANFDIYRKIRDSEGTVGWVNQQLLTSRRTVLVAGEIRELHGDPNPTSEVVARLEPGVIASVSKCDPTWCEVKAGGYKGWLKRAEVWGLEPDEVIQ